MPTHRPGVEVYIPAWRMREIEYLWSGESRVADVHNVPSPHLRAAIAQMEAFQYGAEMRDDYIEIQTLGLARLVCLQELKARGEYPFPAPALEREEEPVRPTRAAFVPPYPSVELRREAIPTVDYGRVIRSIPFAEPAIEYEREQPPTGEQVQEQARVAGEALRTLRSRRRTSRGARLRRESQAAFQRFLEEMIAYSAPTVGSEEPSDAAGGA